ncbi:class I SAM-dependent DNA methyltransferase [Rhizobium tumorigenes]|uniref:Class I SAM-dependent methyltransferase n=1 Tax=Rhizobium tumorigenes TaxID=2041385 RepID=A0AAF1KRB4_9HYPH|nr:class I SAM-dependent methyltransferase [Rhizobium tumorigenes]WFR94226.1 class I SAM-dependent methyltransferase [Rhizobium tumorigenes]
MPDLHYQHPRLAALYDLDNGWSAGRDFYAALAEGGRKRILDLGCGTGLICNVYAARGHDVTGADPASAMLDAARQTPQGACIDWVHCFAQEFRSEKRFDLVIMTGHVFQVLLEERDVLETFATVRQHLSADGVMVFESRNPAVDWGARWNDGFCAFEVNGVVVRQTRDVSKREGKRIFFETRYAFPDEVLVSSSELLFSSREEIERAITESGLKVDKVLGDWNGGPFDPLHSDEMIFFIRHPDA